jgi:hypothetical protein
VFAPAFRVCHQLAGRRWNGRTEEFIRSDGPWHSKEFTSREKAYILFINSKKFLSDVSG